ncbi:MAG: hypothetical protein M0Q53_17485 [Prolixibacteraceae bacterium]|jgi:hypothetical protein|nr:hypothetical protein [Prolixibacteraceae bacterium]
MKRGVFFLFLFLSLAAFLQAQTTEKLNNTTVIKMVKANLSTSLIIDEINNSEVNFDLSDEALNLLTKENISPQIIQAMKEANKKAGIVVPTVQVGQASAKSENNKGSDQIVQPVQDGKTVMKADSILQRSNNQPVDSMVLSVNVKKDAPIKEASPQPLTISTTVDTIKHTNDVPLKKETKLTSIDTKNESNTTPTKEQEPQNVTIELNAVGYVIPLEDLASFFDSELNNLAGTILYWDHGLKNSLDSGKIIKNNLMGIEKKLALEKNTNAKGYTNRIISLKSELSKSRVGYRQFKSNMLAYGMNINKELKKIGNEMDRSISEKFNTVSKNVRSTDPDQSIGENSKSKALIINKRLIDTTLIEYLSPATSLLFFYENEIITIKDIIELWNEEVNSVNKKNIELNSQLEPMKNELIKYQSDSKKNKKEISAVKKQIANIEKERKLLIQQIERAGKELSTQLNIQCKETLVSLNQRLSDVIEDVGYSFQNDFSGF